MSQQLVLKLWNYCNILRNDGLPYGDYVEQLTFLLFLKMADERSRPPFNKPSPIPKGKDWPALLAKNGDDLEIHYRHTLDELGKRSGMLGVIFRKAQNKIQDPAKQERLWTQKLWIYDLRTNLHFTLKENTLKRSDLDDFVACYNPKNRHQRKETERFKCFTYDELTKRDKVNLDIFWRKDDALEESANLPAPHVIAEDVTVDLEKALENFGAIAEDMKK